MWQVLSFLQKNLVWSIPIAMAVGLLYGYGFDASPLKQFIIPVTFIMVYPMMVTLNVKTIFKGQDAKLQITTQIINFVLVPLLAFYTGKLFFAGGPEKYGLSAVGLFLIGVLPTSGMTISWTGFARGKKEAAIKMVVFGLVLGALAAPIYTKVFMGATIDVDMLHMFKQIALFVFVPLFAGLLTQTLVIKKVGRPVKQIVATAQEGDFDLIMGTHGHGKMEERIIGSTASEVIRLSYVPVTVIRLPQEKPIRTKKYRPGRSMSSKGEATEDQTGRRPPWPPPVIN